jgi:hypothetical protein
MMRRRGSQTSIMLTQEEKNNAMPQSDQERRRSMNQDMSNGGGLISSNQQYPPQQVAQPLPMEQQFQTNAQEQHIVQPQNSIQWQQQQQQQQNQPNFSYQQRNRSGSFAIDLISSTTTSQVAPFQNNQTLQNLNLFKSSSHRTSHTAAAGDLLTMSHRALDPPPQQSNSNGLNKKRPSTGSSDFNFVNRRTSSGGNQQQQQQHYINTTPQQHSSIMQIGVGDTTFPNNNDMNQDTTSAVKNTASVSASTMGDDAYNNDDSEHRTIRQCRRSDSFEMMDDG